MRRDVDAADVAALLAKKITSRRARDTGRLRDRGFRDDTKLVPVAHVSVNDRVLAVDRSGVSVTSDVSRGADTDVESFNRPLDGLEVDVVRGLVYVGDLAAMDTDERETYALDVNVMNIGLYEDVVNVKIKVSERRSGDSGGSEARGRESTGVNYRAEKLLRSGKIDVNETLAVRDADRRDRKARVRVEPEKERDEHLKIFVGALVRLVTIVVAERSTGVLGGDRRLRVIMVLVHSIDREFLAHVLEPANTLRLADAELAVDVVRIRVVLIERVTVDIERNLLEETLTREIAPAEKGVITGAVSSGTSEGSGGRVHLDVDNHIVEEITELGDRELHLRAERRAVGNNLVVFETHSSERLEMGVHENDVSLFDISERRERVRHVLASFANGRQTTRKRLSGHKHLILLSVVS